MACTPPGFPAQMCSDLGEEAENPGEVLMEMGTVGRQV